MIFIANLDLGTGTLQPRCPAGRSSGELIRTDPHCDLGGRTVHRLEVMCSRNWMHGPHRHLWSISTMVEATPCSALIAHTTGFSTTASCTQSRRPSQYKRENSDHGTARMRAFHLQLPWATRLRWLGRDRHIGDVVCSVQAARLVLTNRIFVHAVCDSASML